MKTMILGVMVSVAMAGAAVATVVLDESGEQIDSAGPSMPAVALPRGSAELASPSMSWTQAPRARAKPASRAATCGIPVDFIDYLEWGSRLVTGRLALDSFDEGTLWPSDL